jgi:hypothetical protein
MLIVWSEIFVMNLSPNTSFVVKVGIFVGISSILTSCDSIQGYPQDPDNSTAVINSLAGYFDPIWDEKYSLSTDPDTRRRSRDVIVVNRMRAYDIEFDNFERSLYSQGNYLTVGASLATITMGAVGGVAGSAATKAALNVASGAVTGGQSSITKELYYQRTLPALISQMEADRTLAKANILAGLKKSDADYPLVQAYVDLESLKSAGGIPSAISSVTQSASTNQQLANAQLDKLRNVTFQSSNSIPTIEAWLHASGPISAGNPNFEKLIAWMQKDKTDPVLASIPPAVLLSDPGLESDRQRAMKDLNIR